MVCFPPLPASPSDDTVYNIIKKYARGFSDKANVYVVHRLDRDTSGLMLLTRTKQARDKLISNWNNMVIERKYVAVVEGNVTQPEGTIKSFLAENPDTYEMYSTTDKKIGRLAVTKYRVLKQGKTGLQWLNSRLRPGARTKCECTCTTWETP